MDRPVDITGKIIILSLAIWGGDVFRGDGVILLGNISEVVPGKG